MLSKPNKMIRLEIKPIYLLLSTLFFSCRTNYEEPQISLEAYKMEEGFQLEVVASEPFLEAPVAIDFDNKGRIWAVEMRGYMQTISGESEELPNGVISIMEDRDGDGVTDHSKVFLDNLVLPRAIAHVYGGLLYAEPPNLWFVEIENDRPGKKVLVDSLYATEGNVEHQSNGLMMNIDNWIYNSRLHFRYQRRNGVWIKEATSFRGQWGITKDDFGRLYYNDNSTQIAGDFVLPNVHLSNKFYRPKESISKALTRNQRVYPLHATLVNRGYQEGVLDADSMLVNITSACGPLVYRGGQFPSDYHQNAFVCAPEVNLVKRNLLEFNGPTTKATQAWDDKEFLAATDEGFRPVNLNVGPDGSMYIVDMHRGVIQHQAFMTSYLRERIVERGLDKVIGMGRILKVSSNQTPVFEIPELERADVSELVSLLSHQNGWIRDRAQQLLILGGDKNAIPLLEGTIKSTRDGVGSIHAMYAAKGLDGLNGETLLTLAKSDDPQVVAHALLQIADLDMEISHGELQPILDELIARENPTIDLYLLALLERSDPPRDGTFQKIVELINRNPAAVFQDGVVSALNGREEEWKNFLAQAKIEMPAELANKVNQVIEDRAAQKPYWIHQQESLPLDDRTHGLKLFRSTCVACHGNVGQGIEGLAPPLINSEYLRGSQKRLALILLHGMNGPLHVDGKAYEFNAQMPGLGSNPAISDQDLTDLIVYLSNAFGNSSRGVSPEIIKDLRKVKPEADTFTEEELLQLYNE